MSVSTPTVARSSTKTARDRTGPAPIVSRYTCSTKETSPGGVGRLSCVSDWLCASLEMIAWASACSGVPSSSSRAAFSAARTSARSCRSASRSCQSNFASPVGIPSVLVCERKMASVTVESALIVSVASLRIGSFARLLRSMGSLKRFTIPRNCSAGVWLDLRPSSLLALMRTSIAVASLPTTSESAPSLTHCLMKVSRSNLSPIATAASTAEVTSSVAPFFLRVPLPFVNFSAREFSLRFTRSVRVASFIAASLSRS